MFLFASRFKTLLTYFSTSLVFVFILYSYIYPFGYPMMNGLMFEQIPISSLKLIIGCFVDVITVIFVLTLTYYLLRFRRKIIVQLLIIINISLALVVFTKIRSTEIHYADNSQERNVEEYPLKFTKEGKNVLILMLDRLMGGFVEQILKDDPSLYDQLDGFTWYPNTISPGMNSISGVHALLGGYDYTPKAMNSRSDKTLLDISTESFTILPYNFIPNGYIVNLINPKGLGFTMNGDCDCIKKIDGLNCTSLSKSVTVDMAKKLKFPTSFLVESSYSDLIVLLGLMRATPYAFKNLLNIKGPWQPFLTHAAGTTFKEWSELKALPQLSTNESNKNNLNILFNILPHEPYFMGRDCMPQKNLVKFSENEYEQKGFKSLFAYQHFIAAGCSLKLIAEYFEWMKDNNIYDNTKIIIVSDHGILKEVEDHSDRAIKGETTSNFFVMFRSTLFVKERNKRGKLQTSEEFKPNASVPEIVCEEIGGCVNPYLKNKPIKTLGRDDPFYVNIVPWQFNKQSKYKFDIQNELKIINKDSYNYKNWIK
jgi:hypothetical protein